MADDVIVPPDDEEPEKIKKEKALIQAENALVLALDQLRQLRMERDGAIQKTETAELKARFAERVLDLEDTWMTEQKAAKTLKLPGLGPHNLYSWLRSEGILMNDSRNWNLPYQRYIDAAFFRVVEVPFIYRNTGETGIHLKILVSQRGLKYISDLWEKRNGESDSEE